MKSYGAVPIAAKIVALDVDRAELLVTDLEAFGVGHGVQAGVDLQARVRGDRGDQVDDLGALERLAAPVGRAEDDIFAGPDDRASADGGSRLQMKESFVPERNDGSQPFRAARATRT